MPDMSEYHETEDEMEGRADSMRKAEKEGGDRYCPNCEESWEDSYDQGCPQCGGPLR